MNARIPALLVSFALSAAVAHLIAFPLDKAPSVDDVKQVNKLTSDTLKDISKRQK